MTAQQAPQPSPVELVLRTYDHEPSSFHPLMAFLAKHPAVADALLEARPLLERTFAPERVSIELLVEPDDGSEEVFCIVEGSWGPETAEQLLEQFDLEWRDRTGGELLGLLNFDIEFPEHAAV